MKARDERPAASTADYKNYFSEGQKKESSYRANSPPPTRDYSSNPSQSKSSSQKWGQ